jgi:hypothetical protein
MQIMPGILLAGIRDIGKAGDKIFHRRASE